ncbi:MAG: hypothetical protein LBS19_08155 [Clostridiales bacterium]|jgi:hypothetical protein|nr:hypothetical protein [Clostridiales bacterium]
MGGFKHPITVRVTAFTGGNEVYKNEFIADEKSADIRPSPGTVLFVVPVEVIDITPDRLLVEISAGNELIECKEINCEYVTISGNITNFEGKPFRAAVILSRYGFIGFETGMGIWSGADGSYKITVPKGLYNTMYADDDSYQKTSLENWGWHMILDRDERHDLKIGNSEVYSLCAWPNNGGFATLFAYFRPMTLPLALNPVKYPLDINGKSFPVTDICPELSLNGVRAWLNGRELEIISLQKLIETGPDMSMPGYVLQAARGNVAVGKQTLIVEYDEEFTNVGGERVHAASQGRTQFFFKDIMARAIQ